MVSTKARHICTEGLTNKFQESCSEISPDLWWSMDPNKPWGVDSGNLSGSNVVFFISLILKSASMFQVRCHTSSHIFSPHLLVHVCVDDIKLLILFSLDAPFFYYMFSSFSMAIFRPRKTNHRPPSSRRSRPWGLALTLISARCSMSKRMFLGAHGLGRSVRLLFHLRWSKMTEAGWIQLV